MIAYIEPYMFAFQSVCCVTKRVRHSKRRDETSDLTKQPYFTCYER